MTELNINLQREVEVLLREVPGPPGEPIPAGASPRELDDLETGRGFRIPPLLRIWLATSNGPCVGPGGIVGINTKRRIQDVAIVLDRHPPWKEDWWIPVAGDGCGDYYVVATRNEFGPGEPVLFIDTHEDPATPNYIVASNVWQFLRFLFLDELDRTKWPFDETEVVAADPEILSFSGVTLPWDA